MGVSGLHSFLESSHGQHRLFSSQDQGRKSLVIDGSALSYNLWRQERLKEGGYRGYAKALTRFVNDLENLAAFKIEAIYFDGALPSHKRCIRLLRARNNIERVFRNQGSLIHNTPSPAFVVTLTQDVLRDLGYPVKVVLEEADTACAREVRRIAKEQSRECFLMSLDSDLHCFDLGVRGYYVPFDSILWSETSMTGRIYNFHRTQESLGIDIISLVTLMGAEGSVETSRSAHEALRILKSPNSKQAIDEKELQRVSCLFQIDIEQSSLPSALSDRLNIAISTGQMYGRLAESLISGEIWLPQLLEDAAKASSWNTGAIYRVEAYRLLRAEGALDATSGHISEWIRRADHPSGRDIDFDEPSDICSSQPKANVRDMFVTAMRTLISALTNEKDGLSEKEYHAFIVMILGSLQSDISTTDTRTLHLAARYQATIFSLTLLQQVRGAHMHGIHHAKFFDMPTFLEALHLLCTRHTLAELVVGHEEEADRLLHDIAWTPPPRKGRKKQRHQ